MLISFKIESDKNNSFVIEGLKQQPTKVVNAIRRAFYFLGKDLVATTKEGITKSPKIGNRYYYIDFGWTRASKRGNNPANQTGNLRSSISFDIDNKNTLTFGALKEGELKKTYYAKFLEDKGDLNRPFLGPSITINQNKGINYLQAEIAKSL